jgi:hypothetical protein
VPRIKYAMDYSPKNSYSMSYASRKSFFPVVEWRRQWRMAGGECKFVNESTQMTQCISKHSPILCSSFDGVLITCRSSGQILSQHVDIRHCTRQCICPATRATWQVHPTNENASSGQTKCITIRWYRDERRRKIRHIYRRHQSLQQSPCIRSVTYLRHKYTCNITLRREAG